MLCDVRSEGALFVLVKSILFLRELGESYVFVLYTRSRVNQVPGEVAGSSGVY